MSYNCIVTDWPRICNAETIFFSGRTDETGVLGFIQCFLKLWKLFAVFMGFCPAETRRKGKTAVIRVALCDDDASALNETMGFLDRYRREKKLGIVHTAFHSPVELLAEIERGVRFDVLFLDILMPGQNGIEAAGEIRAYDTNVKIVFLTSSSEFAVESYEVEAYFYQLKPLRWESFSRVMDSVLEECERERKNRLILQCKSGITCLDPDRLEFCEVIHRTLLLHLSSGKVLESTGSLEELSRRLMPYGCFLRPHRSYLIHLGYVQSISYRSVTMASLTEIPIPRGKYNEIKDAFLEYVFQNRREQVRV